MADFSFDENVAELMARSSEGFGHDVMTARLLRTKGIDDARQLFLAVRLGRVFVTYNARDSLLLHRAWRLWCHEWGVSGEARHYGILVFPQPPRLPAEQAAILLDRFVRDHDNITNRFFAWELGFGWRAQG